MLQEVWLEGGFDERRRLTSRRCPDSKVTLVSGFFICHYCPLQSDQIYFDETYWGSEIAALRSLRPGLGLQQVLRSLGYLPATNQWNNHALASFLRRV